MDTQFYGRFKYLIGQTLGLIIRRTPCLPSYGYFLLKIRYEFDISKLYFWLQMKYLFIKRQKPPSNPINPFFFFLKTSIYVIPEYRYHWMENTIFAGVEFLEIDIGVVKLVTIYWVVFQSNFSLVFISFTIWRKVMSIPNSTFNGFFL